MTTKFGIKVLNELPATFDPTTMYMIKGTEAGMFEIYMSNSDGSAVRHTPTKAEISAMIASQLSAATQIHVVADITARDAIDVASSGTTQVLVLDATADSTVAAGAATYVGYGDPVTWTKISEYESMDVVLQWGNIQGRPTSTVAQIDDAVAQAHSHANKALLDTLSVTTDNGQDFLTLDGEIVGAYASSVEW